MRQVVAHVAVVALLLALLPFPAQAQQPGPTAKVLWAHGEAPSSGERLWSNFDKEDAKATDTANGPGYSCTFNSIPGAGGTLCSEVGDPGVTDPAEEDIDYTFTLPMDPDLAVPLQFTGTTIGATLFFGASTGKGSGNAVVTLLAGETVIAESGDIPFSYDQGYKEASGEVTVKVTSVAAGAKLVWKIHATGKATGFFLGIHDDNGKSHLTLPLGSSAAVEALTGETVDIERTFNATSNETLRFTWPSPSKALETKFTAAGKGTATFSIKDKDNKTIAEGSQTNGTATGGVTTTNVGNGTWNITLALKGFNGTVHLTIKASSGTTLPGKTSGTNTKAGAGGNGTGNGTDDKKKDTPGPLLPLTLVTVGLVALVRRRRDRR